MLPKDPVILQSVINTALRDRGIDLTEFCRTEDIDPEELKTRMQSAGMHYDEENRRFS